MNGYENLASDIRQGDWVERWLSPSWQAYARLMRLDRPIGIWLLLWPCWWGLGLASENGPSLGLMVLFACGAVVMRGAGCVINDLWDRDIDRRVARTQTRPLAAGDLGVFQALGLLGILLLLGLVVLLFLHEAAILWGLGSLGLVVFYPLAKRFFAAPQLVLGLAFNWGVFVASAAVTGGVSFSMALLYGAGVFWTLGYDTVYAHQDMDDDRAIGVRSLALTLGQFSKAGVAWFYGLSLLLLCACAVQARLGLGAFVGFGVAAFWCWRLWVLWDPEDRAGSLFFFRKNKEFGLIVFIALLLGRF